MKKFILLIALSFPVIAYCQISDKDYQSVVINSIETIYTYERTSKFIGRNSQYNFKKIFESENVNIPNDILRLNSFNDKVSVEEYLNLLFDEGFDKLNVNLTIQDITVSQKTETQGEVIVEISKNVSGTWDDASLNIPFSNGTNELVRFEDTFYQLITIEYDLQNDEFNIININNRESKGELIALVAKKKINKQTANFTDDIVYTITYNGESKIIDKPVYLINDLGENWKIDVKYNGIEGLMLLNNEINQKDFKNKKYQSLRPDNDNKKLDENIVAIEFKQPMWSLEAAYISPLQDPLIFENPSQENVTLTSQSNEIFKVMGGYRILPLSDKATEILSNLFDKTVKVDIRAHAGFMFYQHENQFSFDSNTILYDALDEDGMSYERIIDLNGFRENQNINMMNLLIGASASYKYKKFDLFGYCYYSPGPLNTIEGSYTSELDELTYSGNYNNLYDITLYDSYEDFGVYNDIQGSGAIDFISELTSIHAGGEVRYRLAGVFTIGAGLSYSKSYESLFQNLNNPLNTNYSDDDIGNDLNSITNKNVNLVFDYSAFVISLSTIF